MIEGNKENFNSLTKTDKVLVDFYAPWCGPCKTTMPILEEVEQTVGVKFIKIDLDANPELGREYNIRSIPTLIVMENGKILKTHHGSASKEQILSLLN
jgi:thioredoxin